MTLLALAAPRSTVAQQEPVAVLAVAGVERVLEDVDYVFDAASQPQHAQTVRGVLKHLNGLRGLDRRRPVGVYLHVPTLERPGPQPLFFFPVENLERLLASARVGGSFRLQRGEEANRLTLHTEDGVFPIKLQHGYAFLDPTRTTGRFDQSLPDPQSLLRGRFGPRDAVLILRREGLPQLLLDAPRIRFRGEALKAKRRRPGESDVEYAFRQDVTRSLTSIVDAFLNDWRTITFGLRLSAEDRNLTLDASVALAEGGESSRLLSDLVAPATQFRPQLLRPSALSVSTNWQASLAGRNLLRQLLASIRQQIDGQLDDADADVRSTVTGVLDALDATADVGRCDGFVRLTGTRPETFVLLGGLASADSDKLAAGLDVLLPFAAESDDVRSVDMAVGQTAGIPIHRVVPRKLRETDRRLYGDEAAIYLAAGNGALWLSVGGDPALEELAEAVSATQPPVSSVFARSRGQGATENVFASGSPVWALSMHAGDWLSFAERGAGNKNAPLVEMARAALNGPDDDRFQLSLAPHSDGLRLHAVLNEGYVRLLGLALAERFATD